MSPEASYWRQAKMVEINIEGLKTNKNPGI